MNIKWVKKKNCLAKMLSGKSTHNLKIMIHMIPEYIYYTLLHSN